MKLVLHPTTQTALEQFLAKPGHALLIEGTSGAGKGALAEAVVSELLNIDAGSLANYPFYMFVAPIDNVVTIDAIRTVQRFMRLKTIGDRPIRRILIVENAHALTIEAQNAFLKLLEEPPADTVIIMTTTNLLALLPTVRSRTQHLHINKPTKSDLEKYYSEQSFKTADIDKAYHMSEGQTGLMSALLAEDKDHPLVAHIQSAKELLSMSIFERLTKVDQLTKQREEIVQLLQALQLVCRAGLLQAASRGQTIAVKRWQAALRKLASAQQKSARNPNLKLLMTDLLLSL